MTSISRRFLLVKWIFERVSREERDCESTLEPAFRGGYSFLPFRAKRQERERERERDGKKVEECPSSGLISIVQLKRGRDEGERERESVSFRCALSFLFLNLEREIILLFADQRVADRELLNIEFEMMRRCLAAKFPLLSSFVVLGLSSR